MSAVRDTGFDADSFHRIERDSLTWFREARERLTGHSHPADTPSDQERHDDRSDLDAE